MFASVCLLVPVLLRVLDPHGLAVPGAAVEFRGAGGTVRLTTAQDGTLTAPREPPFEVRVSAAGFETAIQRIEAPPEGELVVRLKPAMLRTSIEVSVKDEAVSAPTAAVRTVFDAVERLVPGAFVTRRGVMGYGIATNGTGVVSIRGVGEQPNAGVLVVIDGRPDFQGLMGHPLPDFYSLSDVESVSVTEGPASVLYGSNAMGGVIEVKPTRPREGFQTRISTALGSYLTGQHRLAHGARLGRRFYSIAGGAAHTRGERPSAAFRSQDGSVGLGHDFAQVWKASLEGRYGHFHVEDPGPLGAPLANSCARVGRGGLTLNLNNTTARNWGYARVYSSFGHHILSDGFRSVDRTTGARLHQFLTLGPHVTLDGGTDLVSYGGRTGGREHWIRSAAGFTRVEWAPSPPLRLNTGVRYDHNSIYGGVAAPEFGATYRISENYSAGVAVARGFRNPTIRELYLFPAPNPLLKPEFVWNYQASVQLAPRADLRALLVAYYADLSNLIVTTGRYPNLRLQNTGRALNRGWEGSARWRPLRRLGFNSGYAWLHSTNLAPYLPEHKANYAIQFDAGPAHLELGGTTVGRRRSMGGYTLATLKLSAPLARRWSLSAMVDNLLNRRYQVIPGYPMPGVNAMAGLSVQF